jgi:hypothetical protein
VRLDQSDIAHRVRECLWSEEKRNVACQHQTPAVLTASVASRDAAYQRSVTIGPTDLPRGAACNRSGGWCAWVLAAVFMSCMSSRRKAAAVYAVSALLLVAAACGPHSSTAAVPSVTSTTVRRGSMREVISSTGEVRAAAQVSVQPEASGRVQQVFVIQTARCMPGMCSLN